MEHCLICGATDRHLSVGICATCERLYIGGLPTTPARIVAVRTALNLQDGEFLEQDNIEIARRMLGRN